MGWLTTILRQVPDPQTGNAMRHHLLDVLMIALTASIWGCESRVEFADFAEDREELFREFLGLENGLPVHDTFSRLFRLIDPEALAAALGRFLELPDEDAAGVEAIRIKVRDEGTVRNKAVSVALGVRSWASGPGHPVGRDERRSWA